MWISDYITYFLNRFTGNVIYFYITVLASNQLCNDFGRDGAQNRGVPKSEEFSGRIKGEVKRGEVVGERTGPEGERGGKIEGKRVGGKKGPKAHLKDSDFGTPII